MSFFTSGFFRFLKALYIKYYQLGPVRRRITKKFHKLYYYVPNPDAPIADITWHQTYWFGVPIQKNPFDLWLYHELFTEIKPDVIIECGTADGGSAFFFASMLDLIGKGRIISVDIEKKKRPAHKRITYITGSSIDTQVIDKVARSIKKTEKRIFVILDSDHSCEHVIQEMRAYAPFVSKGSYMVVEDSNINGHPVMPHWGKGPMEAIRIFSRENDKFEVDKTREKFYMTFNPSGYLKRVR